MWKRINGKKYYAIGLGKPGLRADYGDSHHPNGPYYKPVLPLWMDFKTYHYLLKLTYFTGVNLTFEQLYSEIKELIEYTQKTSALKQFSFMYGLRPHPENNVRQVFVLSDERAIALPDWLSPWTFEDLYIKYPYFKFKASILNKLYTIRRLLK